MAKRKKVIYTDEDIVVIFCPKINKCDKTCSLAKRYNKRIVLCLNPMYMPKSIEEYVVEFKKKLSKIEHQQHLRTFKIK